jgi:hypothetical protein
MSRLRSLRAPARSSGLALAFTLCVASARSDTDVPLDAARWKAAARIEFVYGERGPPSIAYLGPASPETPAPAAGGCARVATTEARPSRGVWVWDTREAVAYPRTFAEQVSTRGFDTVYLQIGPDLTPLEPVVVALAAQNVAVVALNGAPDSVLQPESLLRDVDALLEYNAAHAQRFSGYQVDVEPYTLPGFALDEQRLFERYLDLLRQLRARADGSLALSAVIPFWYAQKAIDGRNLAAAVLDLTDGVAVMSYRTRHESILELSEATLCLAQARGRQAWIGLERMRLESEQHFVVAKERLAPYLRREGGTLRLQRTPAEGAPFDEHYAVDADALSFHRHPEALAEELAQSLPFRSFAGWIVNGETFPLDAAP